MNNARAASQEQPQPAACSQQSSDSKDTLEGVRLRQSLVDALEDLNLIIDHHEPLVAIRDVGDLCKIANLLLDEIEGKDIKGKTLLPSETQDATSKDESDDLDASNDHVEARQKVNADTNWEQVTERWKRVGWQNPLELSTTTNQIDEHSKDDDFRKWEQVHALATTVQLQRLHQRQEQQNPLPKLSLEQQLLQVQDLDQLNQLLVKQSSLSQLQQELIQSAWTFFENDYERRKQAMQQRVRILEESFQKEESQSASVIQNEEQEVAVPAEESKPPAPKTLEMVLLEFQKPRASRPTRTTSASSTTGSIAEDVGVEDRGGRLQDSDATNGMPTWQTTEPNPTSPDADRTGRGGQSSRSSGRSRGRGGGGGNRRNRGRGK